MVKKLFSSLGIKSPHFVSMHCGYQVAIITSNNKIPTAKIDTSIDHIKSKVNLANLLTKPLERKLINDTLRGMGLKLVEKNQQ